MGRARIHGPLLSVGLTTLSLAVITGGVWQMQACAASGAAAQNLRQQRIQTSPQWQGDHFENMVAQEPLPHGRALWRWMWGKRNTVPDQPPPIVAMSAADFAVPPPSGLRTTWLGHSTLFIELDGARLLVDPVWSERASPFSWAGPKRFHAPPLPLSELPPVDAVLISHNHYDHLDEATIRTLAERVPRFIVPLGVGAYLEEWGISPERIVELDWWDETTVGAVTVVATPARHFSGRSLVMADRDRTLWSGFGMVGPAHRVYYSGDTAMFPGFAEIGRRLGPFDVTFMETGAYNALWRDVHIGPEQAVRAHRLLRGGLYVPVHWGTFDLSLHSWTEPVERLLIAAAEQGVAVAVPRPGESFEPASPPALARWWPELPFETADTAPVVSSGLPAELAFGPLR